MAQLQVTIDQGTLRGSIGTDIRGQNFYKFQGIPYAKPPLGELRFKAPAPPEKWSGVFDATKEGDSCYSRDPLKQGQLGGSENCLFLNVFTKKLPDGDNSLRPVLFWIHGGGFIFGSGNEDQYGPNFLITEDVVLVTINYRLGMLGFLSLEDPSLDVPGNAGLKDQVMALKWVQKNIAKFGGDPNNVTIFGESAGGASVHLHVLSPMSKGLFHKAIAQSGCAINPWVLATTGIKKIALAMNREPDEKAFYDELMTKSAAEIFEIQEKLSTLLPENELRAVGVVIENNAKDPFLPKDPIDIMSSGNFNQVPFMIGYTTCEGMIFELFKNLRAQKLSFLEGCVPWYFGYKNGTPEIKTVAEKIKKFYYGNEEPSAENVRKQYDVLSDYSIIYGIYLTTITQLKLSKSPVYLYRMSVETELNFCKKMLKIEIPGVSHLDDVGYLFSHSTTPDIQPGSVEDISLRKFVKLWTNFAKFGNPTPDDDALLGATWKPVTGPNLDFIDIGKDLVPSSNPETERMRFWKALAAESPAGQKLNVLI